MRAAMGAATRRAAAGAAGGAAPPCVEPAWARESVFDESAASTLAALVRAAGAATVGAVRTKEERPNPNPNPNPNQVGAVRTKEERRARPLAFNTVRA